ncbi:N-acetyltransferase [Robertkochia marina]|uniref:N-acetyltransferase n=1 Tax=Robertkochia marina TaxID=1227945 RepID=A0A4S3M2S5_9FLAO|nr:GNAT family N-acetyltransferase [Robertkochia marina]THD67785.1 N-acetyltransferase [Robertkochia marina]TRZ41740.1 N-acetyltransferase [Robertkochia marina]
MNPEDVSIIPYQRKYRPYFINMNMEWLEQLFEVEEHDREILEKCEEYIIQKGGYIFFAKYKKEIVGCYALLRMDHNTYELGKMAVESKYRGLKIGQELMQHCIDFGKAEGWNKLVLYSSLKLGNALHIYRKYGFREIPLEKNSPYIRSSIKMEFIFNEKL